MSETEHAGIDSATVAKLLANMKRTNVLKAIIDGESGTTPVTDADILASYINRIENARDAAYLKAIEDAAKVAERHGWPIGSATELERDWKVREAGEDIASRIRALKDKPHDAD